MRAAIADAGQPRGRPRLFDRQDALAAAMRVFWMRGYERASITELTEAMGIQRPSLYACFGNKETLFREALALYTQQKLGYIETALTAPTASAVAEQLLDGMLELQTAPDEPRGCLVVIAAQSCSEDGETIKAEVIARMRAVEAALVDRFEQARHDGDLPESAVPRALASYLIAVIQGISVQAGSGASADDLRAVAETTLATWPSRF